MNIKIIRNILIQVLITTFIFVGYFYFSDYYKARDYNTFLERAASISELHSQNSVEFENILDFTDTSRDEFEKKLKIIKINSLEAKNIFDNSPSINIKEKELLKIAVNSWLSGIELFEISIINLIDNSSSKKIEEAIARSIVDLSIGDRAYEEFVFSLKQNSETDGIFLPNFQSIEYIGIADNTYQFADLIVERAKFSSTGLFLRKNVSVQGLEFNPSSIGVTEDGYSVLLNQEVSASIAINNNGNSEVFDIVVLILVTDELSETVHEEVSKISSLLPNETTIFETSFIRIDEGNLHEWFIKIEGLENEEDLLDNIFTVSAFIPPEG